MKSNSEAGFTVLELMIATAVFSVVLLLLMISIIEVGRMYFKGITSSTTQGTARAAIDDITQTIQYGKVSFVSTGGPTASGSAILHSYCFNNMRFTYTINTQLETTPSGAGQFTHALWRDLYNDGGCPPLDLGDPAAVANSKTNRKGHELLGDHMRLTNFTIVPDSVSGSNLIHVSLWVAYGDDDLLVPALAPDTAGSRHCVVSHDGGQFCSFSELETDVVKRLH
jgi:prepilin-type N-terminal cleavage/methylation domain-containing protein